MNRQAEITKVDGEQAFNGLAYNNLVDELRFLMSYNFRTLPHDLIMRHEIKQQVYSRFENVITILRVEHFKPVMIKALYLLCADDFNNDKSYFRRKLKIFTDNTSLKVVERLHHKKIWNTNRYGSVKLLSYNETFRILE